MSDDNFSRKQRVTPNYEDLAEAKPKVASPQRAPTPITQTPEFIEAIARAKADIHAEIAPLIDALRQSKGEGQVEGDQMSFVGRWRWRSPRSPTVIRAASARRRRN